MMDVASNVQTMIQPQMLNDELIKVRRALYFDLGVPFPGIHLRYNDKLKAGSYYILMQEIPMSQGILNPGKVFLRDDPDHLNLLGVQSEPGDAFLPGLPTVWVDQAHKADLAKAGIAFMDAPQILTYPNTPHPAHRQGGDRGQWAVRLPSSRQRWRQLHSSRKPAATWTVEATSRGGSSAPKR
jgi:type III secretory pathway component EscV